MKQEEFDTYPDICKRFFGNKLSNLRPYGTMEINYVINNIQPRFIKFAENYQKEEKENMLLPDDYKKMIQGLSNKFELKSYRK